MELVYLGDPCPMCAVDLGPHLHALRPDGSPGILVVFPDRAFVRPLA